MWLRRGPCTAYGQVQRPLCPSRAHNDCEAPAKELVLLDTRTAPASTFDHMQSSKQGECGSRFLDLPLDVLEQIFAYLLIAPGDIYLGVVTLEHQLPHHWHPAYSLRRDGQRDNHTEVLGCLPPCRDRHAQVPYDICSNLLIVNRQLHVIAARMLYSRNAFAIDLGVPVTQDAAQHYDISRLRLEQLIPLNPAYHKLLRRVSFRHYNNWMRQYPVRFFHSAMMHLLQDMPGAFTAFRRWCNLEFGLVDFETFAGWSPTATPTWLADAAESLATSQPLIATTMSLHIDEVHHLMSTLWEGEQMNSDSPTSTTLKEPSRIDLHVLSDPTISTEPWHPNNPQSRPAARIILARPRKSKPEHHWQKDLPREWYESKAYSRFQTSIVARSRGLRPAKVHNSRLRGLSSQAWRDGPKGTIRRVFTAPMSFVVPSVCRFLREEKVKREDRRRCSEDGSGVLKLPIDGAGMECLY